MSIGDMIAMSWVMVAGVLFEATIQLCGVELKKIYDDADKVPVIVRFSVVHLVLMGIVLCWPAIVIVVLGGRKK